MPSTSAKEKGSTRSCSRVRACRYGSGRMSGRVDRSWPSLMNVGPMRSRSFASSDAAGSVAVAAGLSSSRVGSRPAALTKSLRPYFISNTATSLYRLRCCGFRDSPILLLPGSTWASGGRARPSASRSPLAVALLQIEREVGAVLRDRAVERGGARAADAVEARHDVEAGALHHVARAEGTAHRLAGAVASDGESPSISSAAWRSTAAMAQHSACTAPGASAWQSSRRWRAR